MVTVEATTSRGSGIVQWMQIGVLLGVIVLLGMCCYFVYRVSMIAYRMEQSVVAVSADVRQVTSTVAGLSRDVAEVKERVSHLKDKVKDVSVDDVRKVVDEAMEIGGSIKGTPKLAAASENEIAELLKALSDSGCTADIGGKEHSLLTLYTRVYAKYKLKKNSLASAEDFIDQVATDSTLGKTYSLVKPDGSRVPLSEWLKQRLNEIRRLQKENP